MKVNFIGFCDKPGTSNYGPCGYLTHTNSFFYALHKLLDEEPTYCQLTYENGKYITSPGCKADVSIAISAPNSLKNILKDYSGKKIGFCIFEWTKLPKEMTESLKTLDQIWVPSKWGKNILKKHGFEDVEIVPEGVNPQVFSPDVIPSSSIRNLPGFRFLFIGRDDERKNITTLLKAFKEEFKETEPVSLIINCYFQSQKREQLNKVHWLTPIQDQRKFARIYTSCHAFVSASRGEGWGLPLMEAMACGIPVISIKYAGNTEFINKNNTYIVEHDLEQWNLPHICEKEDIGLWANPRIESLKQQMRYVYENYKEAKQRALKNSEIIRKKWTWDNAAKIALQKLNNV